MSRDEMSFCELKTKEIVNEVDGRKLGKACDLVFSPRSGCVLGIVAPFNKRGLFLRGQEVYIPFKNIIKIGPDVILVRLTPEMSHPDMCIHINRGGKREPHKFSCGHSCSSDDDCSTTYAKEEIDDDICDFRCEKCMLFDCTKRWKNPPNQPKYS